MKTIRLQYSNQHHQVLDISINENADFLDFVLEVQKQCKSRGWSAPIVYKRKDKTYRLDQLSTSLKDLEWTENDLIEVSTEVPVDPTIDLSRESLEKSLDKGIQALFRRKIDEMGVSIPEDSVGLSSFAKIFYRLIELMGNFFKNKEHFEERLVSVKDEKKKEAKIIEAKAIREQKTATLQEMGYDRDDPALFQSTLRVEQKEIDLIACAVKAARAGNSDMLMSLLLGARASRTYPYKEMLARVLNTLRANQRELLLQVLTDANPEELQIWAKENETSMKGMLSDAAFSGDLQVMKLLIEKLKITTPPGYLFQQIAANSTNVDLMKYLWTLRPDLKILEPLGALAYAARVRAYNLPMIEFLGSKFSLKAYYDGLPHSKRGLCDDQVKILFACAAGSRNLQLLDYLFKKAEQENLDSTAIPFKDMFYYTKGGDTSEDRELKEYLDKQQDKISKRTKLQGASSYLSSSAIASSSPLYTPQPKTISSILSQDGVAISKIGMSCSNSAES